jgi:DNA repair exonuclease SbcCD ATPase subunit
MAQASNSSASSGLAASGAVPVRLDDKINTVEEKLKNVETEIDNLNKRLKADEFVPDQHYPSVEKLQSKIERLEAKEVALQNEKVALQNKEVELLREKNIHLEQQQQSGAGTSMLCIKNLNSSP